jgi:hypothetical protein
MRFEKRIHVTHSEVLCGCKKHERCVIHGVTIPLLLSLPHGASQP